MDWKMIARKEELIGKRVRSTGRQRKGDEGTVMAYGPSGDGLLVAFGPDDFDTISIDDLEVVAI